MSGAKSTNRVYIGVHDGQRILDRKPVGSEFRNFTVMETSKNIFGGVETKHCEGLGNELVSIAGVKKSGDNEGFQLYACIEVGGRVVEVGLPFVSIPGQEGAPEEKLFLSPENLILGNIDAALARLPEDANVLLVWRLDKNMNQDIVVTGKSLLSSLSPAYVQQSLQPAETPTVDYSLLDPNKNKCLSCSGGIDGKLSLVADITQIKIYRGEEASPITMESLTVDYPLSQSDQLHFTQPQYFASPDTASQSEFSSPFFSPSFPPSQLSSLSSASFTVALANAWTDSLKMGFPETKAYTQFATSNASITSIFEARSSAQKVCSFGGGNGGTILEGKLRNGCASSSSASIRMLFDLVPTTLFRAGQDNNVSHTSGGKIIMTAGRLRALLSHSIGASTKDTLSHAATTQKPQRFGSFQVHLHSAHRNLQKKSHLPSSSSLPPVISTHASKGTRVCQSGQYVKPSRTTARPVSTKPKNKQIVAGPLRFSRILPRIEGTSMRATGCHQYSPQIRRQKSNLHRFGFHTSAHDNRVAIRGFKVQVQPSQKKSKTTNPTVQIHHVAPKPLKRSNNQNKHGNLSNKSPTNTVYLDINTPKSHGKASSRFGHPVPSSWRTSSFLSRESRSKSRFVLDKFRVSQVFQWKKNGRKFNIKKARVP